VITSTTSPDAPFQRASQPSVYLHCADLIQQQLLLKRTTASSTVEPSGRNRAPRSVSGSPRAR
jgi:hypothetical protein